MKKITFIFALAVCALCVSSIHSAAQEMVKVYRWYVPSDDVYVISPEGEFTPAEIKERITEPYITTKSKGTGLGLAIVKEIADRHEGTVDVESSLGKGTTFTISFPVV